jgi:hypothetical protein
MRSQVRRSYGFYGGSRLPALLALLVLGSGCVLAYRHFLQRQGEAAVNLIPADATFVVTLDLKPSPEQVPTFQRIQAALQREQLSTQFDRFMTQSLANSPLARDLHPYITTSMALAGMKPIHSGPANDTNWVGLFAVSDPQRVRDVLARDAQRATQNGIEYYYRANAGDKTAVTVIGDYLVIGGNVDALARIIRVQHGDVPAITTVADYQHARTALPTDANLMIFVPSDAVRQMTTALASSIGNTNASTMPWVAIGMAIRPGGIETFVQVPINAPAGSDLGHIVPIDPHLLSRLPSGAYGLATLSQPSKYWSNLFTTNSNTSPLLGGQGQAAIRALNESVANFERETGMSVPQDILPAFHGDALLAIYPPAPGHPGADGLIVLDDANGADPAALADKVRAYIERQSARSGQNPVSFTRRNADGATIWTLDTASQRQLSQALRETVNTAQRTIPGIGQPGMSGNFAGSAQTITTPLPNGDTQTVQIQPNGVVVTTIRKQDGSTETTTHTPPGMRADTPGAPGTNAASTPGASDASGNALRDMWDGKTMIYAQVGHALLIASSQSMMDRALAAYTHGTGGLATDTAYAAMIRQMPAGAQSLLMVDLSAILQELRPTLTNSMANSNAGLSPDDILHLFGEHAGIVGTQQYDGKALQEYFYMPLDYDRVIHLIGAMQRASGGPNTASAPVIPPASSSVVQ